MKLKIGFIARSGTQPGKTNLDSEANYQTTVTKAVENGAKTALLSRDTKVTKGDAVELGVLAESNLHR